MKSVLNSKYSISTTVSIRVFFYCLNICSLHIGINKSVLVSEEEEEFQRIRFINMLNTYFLKYFTTD